jgi:DNA-directed RNA polymerase specialized sigma subunit
LGRRASEPPKRDNGEPRIMETLLREAKEKHDEIPSTLKEQIVLEHSPLIRYIVNRIAVRLPRTSISTICTTRA